MEDTVQREVRQLELEEIRFSLGASNMMSSSATLELVSYDFILVQFSIIRPGMSFQGSPKRPGRYRRTTSPIAVWSACMA